MLSQLNTSQQSTVYNGITAIITLPPIMNKGEEGNISAWLSLDGTESTCASAIVVGIDMNVTQNGTMIYDRKFSSHYDALNTQSNRGADSLVLGSSGREDLPEGR